jgi:hypothetical protein
MSDKPEIKDAGSFMRHALADADVAEEKIVGCVDRGDMGGALYNALRTQFAFTTTAFLAALHEYDPDRAHRLAVWVNQAMEDGDTAAEMRWQWREQLAAGVPLTDVGPASA